MTDPGFQSIRRKAMTKLLIIAVLLFMSPGVIAQVGTPARQSPTPLKSSTPRNLDELRPRLTQTSKASYTDQLAVAEDEEIYIRSGSNVPLPLSIGTPLVLRLESSLSTNGMNGVQMTREIPLRGPILTKYAQIIAPKDILVATQIVGRGAGFKDRAELMIEPKTVFIEIDSYVLVDESNGRRVFLKPGKWSIVLHCSILAIENPDGRSWYARNENEGRVKGGRLGFGNGSPNADDHASGLLYLPPYGPVIYGFTQIKGLIGFFFKRPNIKLPERTEIHFRIDRMEANYLSAPIPKGPVKVSYR
jgi:hypothetical protein